MTGHLLTVGDEILLGQIVDTNAAWLGERLAAAGVDVRRSETVGDDHGEIVRALERAYADGAAVVIVTGGLGPTHDDVTKAAVAEVFGRELEFRPDVLDRIEARYASRGRTMPAVGRVMAEVPAGFDALPNPTGSAPGLWGEGEGRMVAVMPGVPHEMEAIANGAVLPRLVERQDGVVLSRTLLTVGKGESDLSEMIDAAAALPDAVKLAYLPSTGHVRVRLTARGPSRDAAQADLDGAFETVRGAVGRLAFGEGETTLEAVVLDAFRAAGQTLAVAESCTGGTVLSRLTAIPGASAVVCGGVVAYSNAAKRDLLDVPDEHLDDHGAVSEPVALAMAAGARRRLGADVGLATTGIAGPTGGTPDKPVGTVWIAYDDGVHARAVHLKLTPNRAVNIALSATAVLDLARRQLARRTDG
ncbi:competence/damage-inducible protein A [Rubrivirga sp. IMCC43871]|uniref:competence/damage-inducible protein A n=1 Tax=Rubrivirga sp. IMCC43871 TaxID=3391575 RepID=UPI00398F93A9